MRYTEDMTWIMNWSPLYTGLAVQTLPHNVSVGRLLGVGCSPPVNI